MRNAIQAEELREELIRDGVIARDSDGVAVAAAHPRPWFVSFLLGCSGWLAGIFMLGVVGLLFRPSSPTEYIIAAMVCFAAAYGLYFADKEGAFFDQLALALSIAAQILFVLAISHEFNSKNVTATAFYTALMQFALIWIMPNRLAKILATYFAMVAWSLALRFAWWGERGWFYGERTEVELLPALIGWCVIWIPAAVAVVALIARESKWMALKLRSTVRPGLIGLLLSLSFGTIASEPAAGLRAWMFGHEAVRDWLVIWPLLSTTAAVFVFFAAHRIRHKALMGAAIIAALFQVFHFYYLVGVPLIAKSIVMLVVGAVMVFAGWKWQTRFGTTEARS